MTSIFYEPQDGGLCRKHALNGYFGYSKITTEIFNKYIREYDTTMQDLYNTDKKITAADFDMINGNQTTRYY